MSSKDKSSGSQRQGAFSMFSKGKGKGKKDDDDEIQEDKMEEDKGKGKMEEDGEIEEDDHVSKFTPENVIKDKGKGKISEGNSFNPDIDAILEEYELNRKRKTSSKEKDKIFEMLQDRHTLGLLLFKDYTVPECLKISKEGGLSLKYDVIQNNKDKTAEIVHNERINAALITAFSGTNNVIEDGIDPPTHVRVVTYNASPHLNPTRIRGELNANKSKLKSISSNNFFGHWLEWFLLQKATMHHKLQIAGGGIEIGLDADIALVVEGEAGWLEKPKTTDGIHSGFVLITNKGRYCFWGAHEQRNGNSSSKPMFIAISEKLLKHLGFDFEVEELSSGIKTRIIGKNNSIEVEIITLDSAGTTKTVRALAVTINSTMIVAIHPQQATDAPRRNYHKAIRNFINTKNLQRMELESAKRTAFPIVVNYMCGGDFNSIFSKVNDKKDNVSKDVSIILEQQSNSVCNYTNWNTGTSTCIGTNGKEIVLDDTKLPIDGFNFCTMVREKLSPTHLGIDLKTVEIGQKKKMGLDAVARSVFEVSQSLYMYDDMKHHDSNPKIHLPIIALVSVNNFLLKHNTEQNKLPNNKFLESLLKKQNKELLSQTAKEIADKLKVRVSTTQSEFTIPHDGALSPRSFSAAFNQLLKIPSPVFKHGIYPFVQILEAVKKLRENPLTTDNEVKQQLMKQLKIKTSPKDNEDSEENEDNEDSEGSGGSEENEGSSSGKKKKLILGKGFKGGEIAKGWSKVVDKLINMKKDDLNRQLIIATIMCKIEESRKQREPLDQMKENGNQETLVYQGDINEFKLLLKKYKHLFGNESIGRKNNTIVKSKKPNKKTKDETIVPTKKPNKKTKDETIVQTKKPNKKKDKNVISILTKQMKKILKI